MAGGRVQLEALTKRFIETAVDAIDLDVASGEFFSLLGPSGCGKTTTLRMIAGFERPTSGRILLDGADVSHTPPDKRPVNTVFQSYALFPFLTVADNVGFGLRYHKLTRRERGRKVMEALELTQMRSYAKRRPAEISGGQQQRVALARALVLNPSVLLLDEPLGSLDAKIRRSLKIELKALQERVGITFLYVTHDQEEALTMSDRLAVMCDGRLAQVGRPREVYDDPATTFVADFLGVSNLMTAEVLGAGAGTAVMVRMGETLLTVDGSGPQAPGPVRLCVRPERVVLEPHGGGGANRAPGMVDRTVFVGPATQVHVRLAAGPLVQALLSHGSAAVALTQGTPVDVHLPPAALRILPDPEPPGAEPAVAVAQSRVAQTPAKVESASS
ncbi:MAG TPA: ABC transporter ATP-binding protein [Nocardioidaceae bacterium]|nr:ABC transporter ATP-binding protein [Nocardioidaceae bacterium]